MAAIEKEKITATLIVPTMIQMLTDHPAFRTADLSSLQKIMYGAYRSARPCSTAPWPGCPARRSISSTA